MFTWQPLVLVLLVMYFHLVSALKNPGIEHAYVPLTTVRGLVDAHKVHRPYLLAGSRKNIEEHYDSGNAMYKLFLDETLTYSSGLYLKPTDSLYQAQLNKIDALILKARLGPNDHVLEIGCGWGGFAIRAVQITGCRWTGITISKEQLSEANERVNAAGLQVWLAWV